MKCKCGATIHPKRVEILTSTRQKMQCITCAEKNVQRVAGFMVRDHKMVGELQILSQEQADKMYSLSIRHGVVSNGVKFRK